LLELSLGLLSFFELFVGEVLALLVAAGDLRQAGGDVGSAGFAFSIGFTDLRVLLAGFLY
jgi:hypothetical protein